MSNFNEFWGLKSFLLVLALVATNPTINNANTILHSFGNPITNQIPAIFNFGDSNSDTGSFSAAFFRPPYPYGFTFFGNFSGRACDGRLIIDFIAEKLKWPYMNAYLDATAANFKHGVNFASSVTTIMPVNENSYGYGVNPFSLNIQLLQFLQFKQRVDELYNQGNLGLENRLPKPEDFSKALYTFDIGQNDITLLCAKSMDQAYKSLPAIVDHFVLSLEQIYRLGARNFLIHNTGPLGCLPEYMKLYPLDVKDEIGCSKSLNKVAQEFNLLLKAKVSRFHSKLENLSMIYVDMYSAKYSLLRDAKLYGFVHPLDPCCEDCTTFTIPFWKMRIADQIAAFKVVCDDSSKYISWDGIHYTEAANQWIANKIFDGYFDNPLVKMSSNSVDY